MRVRLCVWVLLVCLPVAVAPTSVWAAEEGLAPHSKSAVLVDADTGTVLYEKNSREKLPPASITKIMTMLLVMEALEKGKISYEDQVRTSEYASSMGGAQIFLETGEVMKLEDLLKAVAVGSANDASVALAEHLAGTEKKFVEMMNQRAEELGMKDTCFQNPNGLPAPNHYSTARDIAIMSRELLKHREITRFTKTYEDYLRKDSKKPFWLVNTNKLVKFYEGLDGLKTGFTGEAGFCLAATAKRRDLRAIAVVMGEPDVKDRNREITRMLDFAFNQYANRVIYKPGQLIGKLQVDKGEKSVIEVRSPQQFSVLMKKGENAEDYRKKIHWEKLKAPIKKGQLLGTVEVEKDGKTVARMELASAREIPQASVWTLLKRTARKLFFIPDEAPAADPET
ncbi:D-alanyl-D-alanine carboxypeptidase (penicillin-binding protein 5/6) [Kroppenstedtia sanguinis]|uniref:serine-type D-Ala-D-Ala carboxypeptidase n=1 Tax=Kroppenstedtia sanguinis TaxID=1380684 RepID=A0ABW4CAM2_9BACL